MKHLRIVAAQLTGQIQSEQERAEKCMDEYNAHQSALRSLQDKLRICAVSLATVAVSAAVKSMGGGEPEESVDERIDELKRCITTALEDSSEPLSLQALTAVVERAQLPTRGLPKALRSTDIRKIGRGKKAVYMPSERYYAQLSKPEGTV